MGEIFKHPISHLNEDQIQRVMACYYSKEPVAPLLEELEIDCTPERLYLHFPKLQTEKYCEACGNNLVKAPVSKNCPLSSGEIHCPNCLHTGQQDCQCSFCVEQRNAESQKNRDRIRLHCQEDFLDRRMNIPVEKLDAMEASILFTLIDSCGFYRSGDENILHAIGSSGTPFTPATGFSEELIQIALESNLISPSPDSPEQVFDLSGKAVSHHSSQMEWIVHTEYLIDLRQTILDTLDDGHWNFNTDEMFRSLVQRISIAEAYEHLSAFLSIRTLPPPEYTSAKSMIRELLSTYTLGQCAYIFELSAVQAADFRVCTNISAQHASSSIIQICRELAEKGNNNEIEIKTFNRSKHTQRSMISIVTDEIMLGAGDSPFLSRIPFKKGEVIEISRNDIEPKKLSLV